MFILCFINTSIRPVFSAIPAPIIVTSTSPNGANDWKFETMLPKNILSCSLVNKFIAIIFSPVDGWIALTSWLDIIADNTNITPHNIKNIVTESGSLFPTLSTEFNTLSNKPTFLFSIFTFPNYIAP